MGKENAVKTWERTSVTNLVRHGQSGTYYARVKVSGKQKWRTLKTKVFSVAKLRLGDVEKETRGRVTALADATDLTLGYFIGQYQEKTRLDPSLKPGSKERRESAVKSILKTWPGLELRDVRKVAPGECRDWAARALREGTGFVAPGDNSPRISRSKLPRSSGDIDESVARIV